MKNAHDISMCVPHSVYLGGVFRIVLLFFMLWKGILYHGLRIYLKFLFITLAHIVVHIGIINQDALSIF